MSIKKRGLGKGLSALISEDVFLDQTPQKDSIINIDVNLIKPNVNQPRQDFSEEALNDLASSIKAHGIIQPITVRKIGKNYEIVAGERRWRASKIAGLKEVPCLVKDIDEEISTQMALIENIQREDLNPIEEAMAYRKLLKDYNLTQEEVAKQVGKSRSYIANTTRLLNLPSKIINNIANGELTPGHGKVLLGMNKQEEQLLAAEKIINDDLNVRATEELTKKETKAPKKKKSTKEPYVQDLEDRLMRILGTRVNLKLGNKKGKIEIEYYSNDDLERIIEILIERG